MNNTILKTLMLSMILIFITIGIQLSVATDTSNHVPKGVKGLSTYINEESQVNETFNEVNQADYNISDTKSSDYVFCEIAKLNGTWDGPLCSFLQDHRPCLPHDHECVNLQDSTSPCDMSCWHEIQRIYEDTKKEMEDVCPNILEEAIIHIKRIKFWVDGVLKVFYFLSIYIFVVFSF